MAVIGYTRSWSMKGFVVDGNGSLVWYMDPKAVRSFKVMTTDSNHKLSVTPNLLNQSFTTEGPDNIWLTDITYVLTAEGWPYLAAVMDLYSRRIVDWAMRDRLHRQVVIDALQMPYQDC